MERKFRVFFFCILVLLVGLSATGMSQVKPNYWITVYSNAPAVVTTEKSVQLDPGINTLTYPVASSLVPGSIYAQSDTAKVTSLEVKSGIGSGADLLNQKVGEEITVTSCSAGGCFTTKGKLVALIDGGFLLRISTDQLKWLKEITSFELDQSTEVSLKPRVLIRMRSKEERSATLSLNYRTSNLSWSPTYTGVIDEENNLMELTGSARLANNSGMGYEDARITLVAGQPASRDTPQLFRQEVKTAAISDQVEVGGLFEYHAYSLKKEITIGDGGNLSVPFVSSDSIPIEKTYVYRRSVSGSVQTHISFDNDDPSGLGVPLAAGTVNLYLQDEGLRFIGQDEIGNIPTGDRVELDAGAAFDIQGEARRLSHSKIGENRWKDEIRITISNRKDKPVELQVIERLNGDWSIVSSSHEYRQIDSNHIRFDLEVGGNSEIELQYVVDYQY